MASAVVGPAPIGTTSVPSQERTSSILTRIVGGGAAGPAGPVGPVGPRPGSYVFTQTTPASVWVINHGLGARPAVVLFDALFPSGPVETDKTYPDLNSVIVEWPEPTSGWAYL